MTKCVQLVPQADGSYKLLPDTQPDLQQCEYVLQTGAEAGNSLLALTPAQATEISMYVCGLWAVAWGFKQVAKVLSESTNHETE